MNKITLPRDFIFEFQLDKSLVDNYLTQVKNSNIKFLSSHTQETTNYAYPIVYNKELVSEITQCINQVGSLYFQKNILKISDIWLTKTEMMQVSRLHDHGLSIFSGLLYLHDSNTETIFTVTDEFVKRHFSLFGDLVKNNFDNSIKIKPQIGKLLIWPSYIKHKVSTNKTKDTRYTLAFNSFLDGELSLFATKRLVLQTQGPDFLNSKE